ncbi:hypothetical protein EDD17DRAFT_1516556 [Pisolithus thermaeus]|nr:hypothetical protein EDD17DRAFT_1516556 [Pisolithus thermaeus]
MPPKDGHTFWMCLPLVGTFANCAGWCQTCLLGWTHSLIWMDMPTQPLDMLPHMDGHAYTATGCTPSYKWMHLHSHWWCSLIWMDRFLHMDRHTSVGHHNLLTSCAGMTSGDRQNVWKGRGPIITTPLDLQPPSSHLIAHSSCLMLARNVVWDWTTKAFMMHTGKTFARSLHKQTGGQSSVQATNTTAAAPMEMTTNAPSPPQMPAIPQDETIKSPSAPSIGNDPCTLHQQHWMYMKWFTPAQSTDELCHQHGCLLKWRTLAGQVRVDDPRYMDWQSSMPWHVTTVDQYTYTTWKSIRKHYGTEHKQVPAPQHWQSCRAQHMKPEGTGMVQQLWEVTMEAREGEDSREKVLVDKMLKELGEQLNTACSTCLTQQKHKAGVTCQQIVLSLLVLTLCFHKGISNMPFHKHLHQSTLKQYIHPIVCFMMMLLQYLWFLKGANMEILRLEDMLQEDGIDQSQIVHQINVILKVWTTPWSKNKFHIVPNPTESCLALLTLNHDGLG